MGTGKWLGQFASKVGPQTANLMNPVHAKPRSLEIHVSELRIEGLPKLGG